MLKISILILLRFGFCIILIIHLFEFFLQIKKYILKCFLKQFLKHFLDKLSSTIQYRLEKPTHQSRKVILNKTSCKNPTLSHISAKPPVQSSTIFIAKIMRDVHNNQQLQGMLEIAVIKLFSPCSISLLTSALQLLPHSPLSSSHTASAFSSAIRPDLPPAFFLSPKKKKCSYPHQSRSML